MRFPAGFGINGTHRTNDETPGSVHFHIIVIPANPCRSLVLSKIYSIQPRCQSQRDPFGAFAGMRIFLVYNLQNVHPHNSDISEAGNITAISKSSIFADHQQCRKLDPPREIKGYCRRVFSMAKKLYDR
jgi:hypothetical protein